MEYEVVNMSPQLADGDGSYESHADFSRSPSLVVTAPSAMEGLSFEVPVGRRSIGRTGDFILEAPGVSREHAWLDWNGAVLSITDAHSTNGTFVNGNRIGSPHVLHHQNVVRVGDVTLNVHLPEAVLSEGRESPGSTGGESYRSETTRLLSAATYLDVTFRNQVIEELWDERYRAVAPSYGVDLGSVLEHALLARRHRLARDLALLALLFTALVGWASAAVGSTADGMVAPWGLTIVVLLGAWVIVTVETWWRDYLQLALGLSRTASPSRDHRPARGGRLRQRLEEIERQGASNVVVFSNFAPFVGSGDQVEGWAFALDIEKGALDPATGGRRSPRQFSTGDLYGALKENLSSLGLPGLRVEERIFINGVDAWRFPSLMPNGEPSWETSPDPKVVEACREMNRGSARTYLTIEVTGWQGQLVVTMFLRVLRLRRSLYLEWTATELLPLRSEFYRVDTLSHRPVDAVLSSLLTGFAAAVPSLMTSPYHVAQHLASRLKVRRRQRQQREQIAANRNFDFGAWTSIRALATGENVNRYFLGIDRDMYVKVVQLRVLKHMMDFLALHDIDTSDFAHQQLNINNSNTINVGGDVGQGAAVGAGAQAGNTRAATSSIT